MAAHWADLHGVLPGGDPAGFRLDGFVVDGVEALVPLAGDGTPQVAEFAPGELGAALGISSHAGSQLVGDALELRHRLPRLRARVQTGQLQAWRARPIAAHTTPLSPETAEFVDAQLAPVAHKIGLQRVLNLLDVALRRFDPDQADRKEKERADGRGVWVSEQLTDGTRQVTIEADALDVQLFDHTLTQIADALAQLDLLDRSAEPDPARPEHPAAHDRPTGVQTRLRTVRPQVTLYVHLSQAALPPGPGPPASRTSDPPP